jgi:hypothetical protein
MRDGLACYQLKPKEFWLAQVLILETYDRVDATGAWSPVLHGPLRIDEWAKQGGFEDDTGLRRTKLRSLLKSLVGLGIVDVNWIESTFEPRPDVETWSKVNGLRAKPQPVCLNQRLLELSAERPLSAALAAISREGAVKGAGIGTNETSPVTNGLSPAHRLLQQAPQGRPVPTLWADRYAELRAALGDPEKLAKLQAELVNAETNPPEISGGGSPEKSGGVAGNFRSEPPEKSGDPQLQQNQGISCPPEKSGGGSPEISGGSLIASLALSSRAKLAIPPEKSGGSPEISGEALEFLARVDRRKTLQGRFAAEYVALCERNPDYVLNRLKPAFEEHERHYRRLKGPDYQLSDPVGWMGSKAAAEGRLRWHGRRS